MDPKHHDWSEAPNGAASHPPETPQTPSPTTRPGGRGRRLARRALVFAGTVAAVGIVAAILGPPLLGRVLAARLGPMFGGEVSIASVRPAEWGRRWIVSDLVVRVPAWKGPAGEAIRLDRSEAIVDPASILRGAPVVERIEIDGGLVRLAERPGESSEVIGTINLQELRPDPDENDTSEATPTVRVRNLRFESGEVLDGRWVLGGRRSFSGELEIDPDASELVDIRLREIDASGADLPGGLVLLGIVDTETDEATLQIRDLAFGPDALRIAPPSVRRLCERLELDGEVDSIDFNWTPGGRLTSTIAIEDLRLRLDVDGEPWARFRDGAIESGIDPPRMRVTEGLIKIDGDRLELIDCRGLLGGEDAETLQVPFSLGFSIDLLTSAEADLDWDARREALDQVLRTAPFVLDLAITDFGTMTTDSAPPGSAAIELPLVAARILEKLGARAWELGVDLHVERGPVLSYRDDVPEPAPLEQSGRLRLRDGEGSYFRFPYPLEDVAAELRFEGDRVEIVELTGRGPTGADVSIAGELLLPAGDVAVDISIESPNLPIDEHLRAALQDGPRRLLEELFDREAADRLAGLGLLEDDRSLEVAREVRDALQTRLRASDLDAPSRHRLEREAAAIARRLEAGPFRIGGTAEVALRIEQGLGKDAPLVTTGTIAVDGNGVLPKGFNYPVVAGRGVIRLEDERILLEGDGIPFTTPGGAEGVVAGLIDIPRRLDPADGSKRRGFEPHLSIRIPEDRPTAALLATLEPPAWIASAESCPRGWADLVEARGTVAIDGELLPDPEEGLDPDWRFTAELSGVRIRLLPPIVAAIARLDLDWPQGVAIDGVSGMVELVPGEVAIAGLDGRIEQSGDPAAIAVQGTILPREPSLDISVRCEGLDARTWLDATRDPAEESMWIRRGISGVIDAEIAMRRRDAAGEILTSLVGGRIEVDGESRTPGVAPPRLALSLDGGRIEFAEGGTRFEHAAIDAGPVGTPPTDRFELDGTEPLADRPWAFRCDWRHGLLEGPVVSTAIREFIPEIEAGWRSVDPRGAFSLGIGILDDGSTSRSTLDLRSEGGFLVLDGERLRFATGDSAVRFEIDPASIRVSGDDLRLGDAPSARVSGTARIDRSSPLAVEFRGDVLFDALPSPALVVLPEGIRSTLAEITLESASPVSIEGVEIDARWEPDDPASAPSTIRAAGSVIVEGASFEAGLAFGEVVGRAAIAARRGPGEPLSLEGLVAVDRLVVLGREVVEITSRLAWNERENRLRSDEVLGRVYGGVLRAAIDADLAEETFEAEIHLDEVAAGRLIAGEREGVPQDGTQPPDALPDGDAGRLRGRIAIEGHFGEDPPEPWRIGRGRVSIEGGRLARDPLSMSLLQLSQLMLPMNDALADLDASFHIENDRLALERIDLRCDTLLLNGAGEVDLETMTIGSVLEVRGRVPGFSDLLSPIAGLLYAVELDGPIADPKSSLKLLPGLSDRPVPAIRMTRVEEALQP